MQASPEQKHDGTLFMNPKIPDTRWNYEPDPMHNYPLAYPADEDFVGFLGSQPEQARPRLADNIGQPKRTRSKLEAPKATRKKSYSIRFGTLVPEMIRVAPSLRPTTKTRVRLGRIGNADTASGIRVLEEAAVDAEEGHFDAAALQPQHQTAQLPVSRIDKSETKSRLPSTNAKGEVVLGGAVSRGMIDLLNGLDGL